jgi:hypothetical protein
MQLCKHKFKIAQAKKHAINLSQRQLSANEYLLLSRGLKFIPTPFVKGVKAEVLTDFDELARKMRCRYLYHDNFVNKENFIFIYMYCVYVMKNG